MRLGVALGLAGVTLRELVRAGDGTLAAPPASSWTAVSAWYDEVGAVVALMSVLRLVAVAGLGWVVVALVLQLLATESPRRGVRRLADVLSPRAVRRLAHGAASLSVTAGLSVPSFALAAPAVDPPGTAVMELIDADEPTTTTALPPAPPGPVEPAPLPVADEVVVEAGDSFWSLAEAAVADASGAAPRESEVQRYWLRLIDANRDRLVVPDNPDLLFPAQRLVLPPVDPAR